MAQPSYPWLDVQHELGEAKGKEFTWAKRLAKRCGVTWLTGKAATHQDLGLSCKKPIKDYTRIEINGYLLNQRTLKMFKTAKLIYGGVIDITGDAMTDRTPIRDPHGGPIVCEWMLEKVYPNKTATPSSGEKIP